MIHIISILETMLIYLVNEAQIILLQVEKALIKILAEYLEYTDIISADLAMKLLEYTGIKNHAIKL